MACKQHTIGYKQKLTQHLETKALIRLIYISLLTLILHLNAAQILNPGLATLPPDSS